MFVIINVMSATSKGGKKLAKKLLARDPEYYSKIGKIGGKIGRTGGFAGNRALASRAGKIGGMVGRNNGKPISEQQRAVILAGDLRRFHDNQSI